MDVGPDPQRAARKLSQIGYYRLSGFWYPCREIEIDSQGEAVLDTQTGKPRRLDAFMPGTSLQGILDLYLYDKRLRLAVLDAIERIEVHIRTVIAHELGRLDPVAHTMASFINQRFLQDYQDRKSRKKRNTWNEWVEDHGKHLSRCSEDCILWHKQNDKTMPFWVVVEAWSFGLASRYYSLLKRRHQLEIAKRFVRLITQRFWATGYAASATFAIAVRIILVFGIMPAKILCRCSRETHLWSTGLTMRYHCRGFMAHRW